MRPELQQASSGPMPHAHPAWHTKLCTSLG